MRSASCVLALLASLSSLFACSTPRGETLPPGDGSPDLSSGPQLASTDAGTAACTYIYTGYGSAGADGILGTADDPIVSRIVLSLDAAGRLAERRDSGSPGPDGAWGTADDVVTTLYRWSYQTAGGKSRTTMRAYDGPGADAVWGTADNHPSSQSIRLGADSSPMSVGSQDDSGPGADGVLGTSDDVVLGHQSYSLPNADGHFTWLTVSSSPGPDGVWETADDQIALATELRYGTSGEVSSQWVHTGPGLDHAWRTSDDVTVAGYVAICGSWNGVREVTGAGVDGLWGTADDALSTAYTIEAKPQGCGYLKPCSVLVL